MKRIISASLISLPLVVAFFGASVVAAQSTPTSSCLIIPANLSVGSTGASVTDLQNFLVGKGYLTVQPTGYYGALTKAAVANFQTDNNIPAVGSVGPITRAQLQIATCESTPHAPATQSTPQVFITVTNPATTTSTAAATTTNNLPYHATAFDDWQTAWGNVATTSTGALELQGSLTNNGAEAIYPASSNWSNYRYQADLSVANGNVSLIGRYKDSSNFIACSFASGWVEIDLVNNGSTTVATSKSIEGILPGISGMDKATSLDMTVNGNTVSCGGFGPTDNISYTFAPNDIPAKGSIGVESWYETPLADKLDLIDVKVDPL